jgi:hypothetical protein
MLTPQAQEIRPHPTLESINNNLRMIAKALKTDHKVSNLEQENNEIQIKRNVSEPKQDSRLEIHRDMHTSTTETDESPIKPSHSSSQKSDITDIFRRYRKTQAHMATYSFGYGRGHQTSVVPDSLAQDPSIQEVQEPMA